ncbi:ATP-binding cassette subfamily F protein 3 [Breznakia sp. PF5-3]|uniref:ATP-binding cassette domain-containing protein n=1 Tax=unclassified Breznakia TaxID=2623764 RepID=UPI00240723D3|nr:MULTISPECIES: ATP-binding cassette domain-containing protein [unclassified Breznakia]MDF9825063.1 ATP-binding cassette subfamily F protein 3 [Breznakia sp. PM6-1]MDF9835910.1 ATP-binding cassette subfamily F protein 3 [Breznakia sp. PF5-3]MDF9837371.1 ATP-binding cassette subfamily F protein 3 [Breznakia sp. PFB2-8]MDF9859306.1 ATP-binding cassette subfamily F protein 3 [Breznakia sp. PH5-24]
MLKIQHLTITDTTSKVLINDLSLIINKGDKIAIIGEEGNGKSTLLKAIYDKRSVHSYAQIIGTIDMQFDLVAYLPQQIGEDWNACFIYEFLLKDQIDEELDYNLYQTYEALCVKINIPKELLYRDQKMKELSGGERVKLRLLKVLKDDPDLLLLDEPTNDLDISTIEWLSEYIKMSSCGVLFISHDIELIEECADQILHLEQRNKRNKPVWTLVGNDYHEYVEQRNQLYDKEKQVVASKKREYKKQMNHINDIKNAVTHAQNNVPRSMPFMGRLLKKKMKVVKGIEERLGEDDFDLDTYEEEINLQLKNEHYHASKRVLDLHEDIYINDRLLIKDCNIEIFGQDKIALIGDNGTGKTILLKTVRQIIADNDLDYAYMPQNYEEILDYQKTPIQFLQQATESSLTQIQEFLGAIHLTALEMDKKIMDLSEGQKAKLCVVYLILSEPKVLLMDEPTRNISPLSKPVITRLLKEYQGCLILTTHDRYLLNQLHPKVYKIDHQKWISE